VGCWFWDTEGEILFVRLCCCLFASCDVCVCVCVLWLCPLSPVSRCRWCQFAMFGCGRRSVLLWLQISDFAFLKKTITKSNFKCRCVSLFAHHSAIIYILQHNHYYTVTVCVFLVFTFFLFVLFPMFLFITAQFQHFC